MFIEFYQNYLKIMLITIDFEFKFLWSSGNGRHRAISRGGSRWIYDVCRRRRRRRCWGGPNFANGWHQHDSRWGALSPALGRGHVDGGATPRARPRGPWSKNTAESRIGTPRRWRTWVSCFTTGRGFIRWTSSMKTSVDGMWAAWKQRLLCSRTPFLIRTFPTGIPATCN